MRGTVRHLVMLSGALALLTSGGTAEASLIQFSNIIDISACPTAAPGQCNVFSPIPTESLGVGDTVDYSVTFANSKRLAMYDDDGGAELFYGWLAAKDNNSSFTITNASVTFLGLIGTPTSPLLLATESNGQAHIGPAFHLDFIGTGSGISFSGYQVQYTITALAVNPHDYSTNWLFAGADRMEVTDAVPEPGTLALLAVGLGALGVRARRRA